MEPRSRGRLTLASPDPEVAPVMDHGYLSDPHDVAVLIEGIERARELWATEPLRSLVGEELAPGRGADLEKAIRRTHVHYCHPVGTARSGPPPTRSQSAMPADGCTASTGSPPRTAR